MTAEHIHVHDHYAVRRVVADSMRFGAGKGYATSLPTFGRLKPTALVLSVCSCGKEDAVDYGERKAMVAMARKLTTLRIGRLQQQEGVI